jgi:hypothetical protein
MLKRGTARLLAAVACILIAGSQVTPAQAQGRDPFVFVSDVDENGRDGTGFAWWLLRKTYRPTAAMVSGVSLARINAHLGAAAGDWCYIQEVTERSFVAPGRAVQTQINETFQRHPRPFRATLTVAPASQLDAAVGAYETCGGEAGLFILITDRAQAPQIMLLDVFEDWDFAWIRTDGETLFASSCFECGHAEALYHDGARDQFYWRNVGD